MKKTNIFLTMILLVGILFAAGCERKEQINPASAYCKEQGYNLEVRTDENGNQQGFCVFPDGSECEEWSYYKKECGQMCGGIAGLECGTGYECNMLGRNYTDASGICTIKQKKVK